MTKYSSISRSQNRRHLHSTHLYKETALAHHKMLSKSITWMIAKCVMFFLSLHNRHHRVHMWRTTRVRCPQVLVRSSLQAVICCQIILYTILRNKPIMLLAVSTAILFNNNKRWFHQLTINTKNN